MSSNKPCDMNCPAVSCNNVLSIGERVTDRPTHVFRCKGCNKLLFQTDGEHSDSLRVLK